MGQFSLLAVVGAFLLSAVVIYNASNSAGNAEDKVWEHQYHVIARDAASTGMSATTRKLSANLNNAWNGGLEGQLAIDSASAVAYDGGRYWIRAKAHTGTCPLLTGNATTGRFKQAVDENDFVIDGDVIEVQVTGEYDGAGSDDGVQSHRISACFVKADFGLFSPPAFNFGFISEDDFTFNGGADIQALVDGSGHVHSNDEIKLGPQVDIDGVATYLDPNPDIHANTDLDGHEQGVDIPMTLFDPEAFANEVTLEEGGSGTGGSAELKLLCDANPTICRYDDLGFSSSGGLTTIQPDPNSDYAGDPYVWFIDGDFTLSGGAHIELPQYTTIVVTGNVDISGQSAVTRTGQTMYDLYGNSPTDAEVEAWVVSQLFDGQSSPFAWYVGSVISVPPDVEDDLATGQVDINGTAALVGNFYANGDITLNGGGQGNNTVGSFASTSGDVTANGGGGGGNFWFLEVAEENVIDGVKLPGKQIVRLALAEWTDPVLDHTP